MGIATGEHRLIKEERRAEERWLGTVLLGRTHTFVLMLTHILYVLTHNRHAQSLLQASETLPLCVMASEADMAEWVS